MLRKLRTSGLLVAAWLLVAAAACGQTADVPAGNTPGDQPTAAQTAAEPARSAETDTTAGPVTNPNAGETESARQKREPSTSEGQPQPEAVPTAMPAAAQRESLPPPEAASKSAPASSQPADAMNAPPVLQGAGPLKEESYAGSGPAQGAAPHLGPTGTTGTLVPPDNRRDYEPDQDRPGAQPMVSTARDPVSTFSLDADRASYHRALTLATEGNRINPADVRAEEWINALDYGYRHQRDKEDFDIIVNLFEHPDTAGMHMARIGFKAPESLESEPQVNVTLVIDTSGSMREGNRIRIAQEAAFTLANSLKGYDNIAIVLFSQNVTDVMEHRPAREFRRARDFGSATGILNLNAGGSTNVQAGLDEGLWLADQVRRDNPNAVNYVVLLSDGVANVNATDPFAILHNVGQDSEYSRRNPIRIITIGVGIQGYNDQLLEQIAQHGNGWYRYFDNEEQARRTFSQENWTRIVTPFADQARAQVTWNPEHVHYWRIVGYENRFTADANFTRNLREFAEIPAGAETTVFYELQLSDYAASARPNSLTGLGQIEMRWVMPSTGQERRTTRDLYYGRPPTLHQLAKPCLELAVYAGLMADIYASLGQGGYGTGGADAFRRLDTLLENHRTVGQQFGSLQAYQDMNFLLGAIRDQTYQYYWKRGNPPPLREGPGSGGSGYSP